MGSDWELCPLGDLSIKIGSGITPRGGKRVYKDKGIPLIRSQNVYNHHFDYDGLAYIDEKIASQMSNVEVLENDVLINITGNSVARCTIVPRNLVGGRVNQHVSIIRARTERLNPEYLRYYLTSPKLQTILLSLANEGGTRAALTKKMLEEIEIHVPPLGEQQRIAGMLSAFDDRIQLNEEMNKTLEAMAQAIFQHWFTDFEFPNEGGQPYKSSGGEFEDSELGPIPKGWKVSRYTDMVDGLSGGTPRTNVAEYWNGRIPFFTPKDMRGSFYVVMTEKYISELGLSKCNSKLYPVDTAFITARGTVGKIALTAVPMAMNQSCYALWGKNGLSQYFIFMLTKNCVHELMKKSHGAVFDSIIMDTFDSLKTIVPSTDLINRFHDTVCPLFDKMKSLSSENECLAALRDTLLPKLISGEIRVI